MASSSPGVTFSLPYDIVAVRALRQTYEKICKIIWIPADFPAEIRSVNVFQKIEIDRRLVAQRYRRIDEIYASAEREAKH